MLIYLFLLNYLFISYVNCSSNNLYDNKDCPVEELNKESYKNLINKNKPTIIVFYAPVIYFQTSLSYFLFFDFLTIVLYFSGVVIVKDLHLNILKVQKH